MDVPVILIEYHNIKVTAKKHIPMYVAKLTLLFIQQVIIVFHLNYTNSVE